MGLLDKLFGGDKQPETPAVTPTPPPSPVAAPEASGDAVPARRERVKRPEPSPFAETTLAPSEFDPIPQAVAPQPVVELPPIDPGAENAALLIAINGIVRSDNSETRPALYRAFLEATLYLVALPNPETGEQDIGTGEVTLTEGQQIQLATVRSPQGQTFLPAFTDLERLQRSLPEKARYLRLPSPAVSRMFAQGPGDGIVINPGQPPSGVITRAEASVLAMNAIPQVGPDGQITAEAPQQVRIQIGKPAAPPASSFMEAIRASAQQQPVVKEVHVFSAGVEDQPMRLMIGVLTDDDLTPEQMHPAFEAIGKSAYEARGDTEAFDMMPLQEGMIDAIRPLEGLAYVRSTVG